MTIGIMSAMTEEVSSLEREIAAGEKVTEIGRRQYYEGQLWGVPSVLAFSRWGKVAAATTATSLISRFDVKALIFTGVAGAIDPEVHVGDIVVATRLDQDDMDARPR
jgi:adenosylhomocysteine nucleosidase